jgi:hypothetical protein
VLEWWIFYSLKEAQVVIERWRVEYNKLWLYSALGIGNVGEGQRSN